MEEAPDTEVAADFEAKRLSSSSSSREPPELNRAPEAPATQSRMSKNASSQDSELRKVNAESTSSKAGQDELFVMVGGVLHDP